MDIYDRLEKDHETQRDLGKRLADTEGDSDTRQDLWDEYKAELESHANAEEQTLYAELLGVPETQEQARHSVHEHEKMNDIVEELDEMDMSSPGWLTRFKALRHAVEHHLDEEEADVFPQAREVVDDEQAETMVARFDERKLAEK